LVASKFSIDKGSNIKNYTCWNVGFCLFLVGVKGDVPVGEFYRVVLTSGKHLVEEFYKLLLFVLADFVASKICVKSK
jgi:hypothetical protein